jgi:hypothetical protein
LVRVGQLLRPCLGFPVRVPSQPVSLPLDHILESLAQPLGVLQQTGDELPYPRFYYISPLRPAVLATFDPAQLLLAAVIVVRFAG